MNSDVGRKELICWVPVSGGVLGEEWRATKRMVLLRDDMMRRMGYIMAQVYGSGAVRRRRRDSGGTAAGQRRAGWRQREGKVKLC